MTPPVLALVKYHATGTRFSKMTVSAMWTTAPREDPLTLRRSSDQNPGSIPSPSRKDS